MASKLKIKCNSTFKHSNILLTKAELNKKLAKIISQEYQSESFSSNQKTENPDWRD